MKPIYLIIIAGLLILAGLLTGHFIKSKVEVTEPASPYEKEILTWHETRIKSLLRDQGWLTLVALTWLKEGQNELESIGMITLRDTIPLFTALPTATATLKEKPVQSLILKTDADKGGPDKITSGTKTFAVIKRGGKFAIRMWDTESPVRKEFTGIDRFPIDEKWKIEARWEPYPEFKKVTIPTVVPGIFETGMAPGVAVFSLNGKEYRIEPVSDDSLKEFSFIFSDLTAGKETYGGGRFLDAKGPVNGKVILDFNKAYNPPCAFTSFATCPVPLQQNRLQVRIEAGEKNAGKH